MAQTQTINGFAKGPHRQWADSRRASKGSAGQQAILSQAVKDTCCVPQATPWAPLPRRSHALQPTAALRAAFLTASPFTVVEHLSPAGRRRHPCQEPDSVSKREPRPPESPRRGTSHTSRAAMCARRGHLQKRGHEGHSVGHFSW